MVKPARKLRQTKLLMILLEVAILGWNVQRMANPIKMAACVVVIEEVHTPHKSKQSWRQTQINNGKMQTSIGNAMNVWLFLDKPQNT